MTERKCTCNKHFSIKVRGPNIEAGGKSAYNNVQVGVGPNIEKLDFQFLQAMEVGVGRRNKFCENIISVPPHSK
ncbi:hypothetical protein FVP13_00210 [Staphylococcus aureus]|nr:hypothetical protein CFN13_03770 [Staphylococcus aureus]MBD6741160.1 hypothetical protein [Staphylococcus aureus]MBG1044786.1 hypothetical protein [Staphylococcus aureus]MST04967.1 hypothetical protein [Staphylococcus aureus]MSU10855.1 hypothetical protein [Staphylococcus aureus]